MAGKNALFAVMDLLLVPPVITDDDAVTETAVDGFNNFSFANRVIRYQRNRAFL